MNCEHYVTLWKYGIAFSTNSNNYHKFLNVAINTAKVLLYVSSGVTLVSFGVIAGIVGIAGSAYCYFKDEEQVVCEEYTENKKPKFLPTFKMFKE
jgi:hypothetical protein